MIVLVEGGVLERAQIPVIRVGGRETIGWRLDDRDIMGDIDKLCRKILVVSLGEDVDVRLSELPDVNSIFLYRG